MKESGSQWLHFFVSVLVFRVQCVRWRLIIKVESIAKGYAGGSGGMANWRNDQTYVVLVTDLNGPDPGDIVVAVLPQDVAGGDAVGAEAVEDGSRET